MLVTVVAVPGDRIRLTNAQVLVNDRPVIGFSVELLTMVAQSNRVPAAMPDDQYLVMGEWRLLDDVVRKWGTYSAKELESASVEARQ
jgi:hypothetical protein